MKDLEWIVLSGLIWQDMDQLLRITCLLFDFVYFIKIEFVCLNWNFDEVAPFCTTEVLSQVWLCWVFLTG